MATFRNSDAATINAALAPYANDHREFHVEITDYGHRLEVSTSQIIVSDAFPEGSEQFRNGCLLDMADEGTAALYAELGHDKTIESFIGLCVIALVGWTHRVKAKAAKIEE